MTSGNSQHDSPRHESEQTPNQPVSFHPKCLLLLGGYGKSPDSEALKTDQNRVDLLSRFMESLGVRAGVLLSPSMSGHYSIPFLMKNNAQLHGFIPIAPVGTRSYTPQQYQNIKVRWGDECIQNGNDRHDGVVPLVVCCVNKQTSWVTLGLTLNSWVNHAFNGEYIPLRHDQINPPGGPRTSMKCGPPLSCRSS